MKRLLWIGGALLALFAVIAVAAVLLIDAESFRKPITDQASKALGREMTLGELDLKIFPLPAVRARQIRIAGVTPDAKPFAEIAELDLRVSVLPLLARKLVLRSVTLQSPRFHIPFDKRGNPILPQAADTDEPAKSGSESDKERAAATDDASDEPVFAVDRIRIRDASVEAGPYAFSDGTLDGALTLAGGVNLTFDLGDTRYAEDDTKLSGPVKGALALGDEWSLDLDGAAIEVGDSFRKPAGERLRLSGTIGDDLDAAALSNALLELGGNQIPLGLALGGKVPEIEIRESRIDIAALRPFLSPDLPEVGGALVVQSLKLLLGDAIRVNGNASLDAVSMPLDQGPALVSGPLVASGTRIALEKGTADLGGTPVELSAAYDLSAGTTSMEFGTKDADLQALGNFLAGSEQLAGVLGAGGKFRMGDGLETLTGNGRLDITPGRIRGFSLLEQVLGPLAQLPLIVAQLKGKDLKRYQEEEFTSLTADYRIDNGVLRTDNLTLAYKHATATLRGSVGLVDGALDMSGQVVLAEEVDAELSGGKQGKRRVIPIAGVGGTVTQPRLRLDANQLAHIAGTMVAQDKIREQLDGDLGKKIEEKLGPGSKEAIEGILGGLFGNKAPAASKEAEGGGN